MTDTTVKYFDSTMSGAPALSGTAGTLIAVLDACLVNGFGSVTLDSLVVASNVATGTVSAGHYFAMVGDTGPVITIAGATPSALNGEWRVASIPGSTTFTFATTGISNQTATGTITAKRSPAGFEKAVSGTNKAAYRSLDIQGTRLYLRIDDSTATYAAASGYETMSDIDTGTGTFTGNGGRFYKSLNANANARNWRVFGDSRCFYFFANKDSQPLNLTVCSHWFGDFIPNISDPYGCGIIATNEYQYDYALGYFPDMSLSAKIARSYTQLGGPVNFGLTSHRLVDIASLGGSGTAYPSPIGNEVLLFPVLVTENGLYRGNMPGYYGPAHKMTTTYGYGNDGVVLSNVQINGGVRDFMILAIRSYNAYRGLIDLTGPWR